MIKAVLLFLFATCFLYANEDPMILLPWAIGFIVAIGIFFWGIYKAIKTQSAVYMLALLPILFLMIGMFFV